MPLRDVLDFGHKKRDEAPVAAELIDRITELLAQGDGGIYDVDEVLKAIVLAVRALELEDWKRRDTATAELAGLKAQARLAVDLANEVHERVFPDGVAD